MVLRMRRLLLLRHSKAAPGQGVDDFDRELTASGQIDATHIGDEIVKTGFIPDLTVFSGALRTRETAEIVAARFPHIVEAMEENALYEATRYLVLALLRALPDSAQSVLVVGHNPGIADIANQLTGEGAKDDRLRMASKYPTSALAVLEMKLDHWADLEPRSARLLRYVTPSDLGLR